MILNFPAKFSGTIPEIVYRLQYQFYFSTSDTIEVWIFNANISTEHGLAVKLIHS